MKLLSSKKGIKWLNDSSTLSLLETSEYKFEKSLMTSVFCFVIYEDQVCFINNLKDQRGQEIPGGHIEAGESPEAAVRRECFEEASLEITNPKLIGIHKIENKVWDGKYPMIGYQGFYLAYAKVVNRFEANEEVSSRSFYGFEEALKLDWVQSNPELYELFRRASKTK